MKTKQSFQLHQTRLQIVNERPKITDISMPRDLYSPFYNRAVVFYRGLFRVVVGIYFILRWHSYSTTKKQAIKDDYFSYFWYRKYKLHK